MNTTLIPIASPVKTQSSIHRTSRWILFPALLGLILAGLAVGSGNVIGSGEEWRPINPSDLAQKVPMVEPDADAEAIFWDIRIDNSGGRNDLELSHYIRIKIFTERGRNLVSKIDIPFLSGTTIKDVAARTIKPDGSIVELSEADVVEKTVVKASGLKLRAKSFAFPAIEAGAIVEYKWKEVFSNSTANNMRIQFQREIPVQAVTYHIKPANWSSSFDVFPVNTPKAEFQKEKDGFEYITITKVPTFREEPFMPPEDNIRSWALIKYHSDHRPLLSYQEMASDLNYDWRGLLKVDDDIKRKAAEIVAGAATPEQKLEKIFAFCRANIKNSDDKNSGFTSDEVEKLKVNKTPADTLKRGVGQGLDINLLFAALANATGIEAHIALLPDRGKMFFERSVLIPGVLSSSTIAVRVGGVWKFFNPGDPYSNTGMSRWQVEGVDALIVDKSPTWTMTPISTPDNSRETRVANLRLDENGTLEGDVSIEQTGHLALQSKEQFDDVSANRREESLKAALKQRLSTAELTDIVMENVTDPAKPFVYKYHVRIPEYAQHTGKRLFLQPGYFEKGVAAVFASSVRRYPVYFHFAWSEEDKVTISLPKGYVLDNPDAPPPINAGAVCRYAVKMELSKDASTLVYKRSFSFGNDAILLFPTEGYGQIKRLFDEINKYDNRTIALKQIAAAN